MGEMPRRTTWSPQVAHQLHLTGLSWAQIAETLGVAGESTVREGVRRYLGRQTNTARSAAAQTAAAARWSQSAVIPLTQRTFGVEIEFHTAIRAHVAEAVERVVGYHIHMVNYHGTRCCTCGGQVSGYSQWKLETDSSATRGMRNVGHLPRNQGGELVSPVLSGEAGIAEVKAVMQALRSVGAKVDKKHGMHMHLGVADMSTDHKIRLVNNFYNYQTQLFDLVASSRRNNHYCRPMSHYQLTNAVSAFINGRFPSGNHTDAMNLTNLARIGTIEMRLHQGTLNGKKAEMWIRLMLQFFEVSRAHDEDLSATGNLLDQLHQKRYISAIDLRWYKRRAQALNPSAAAAA